MLAVEADGRLRWAFDAGAVEASPSIAKSDGGQEIVFAAAKNGSASTLFALAAADAGVLNLCPFSSAEILGSFATAELTRATETVASGVAVVNASTGRVVAIRPGASQSSDWCLDLTATGPVDYRGGVVTDGTDFFWAKGSSSTTVRAATFSESWSEKWTSTVNLNTRTPAVVGSTVLVAGAGLTEGGIVALALDGGSTWAFTLQSDAGVTASATSPTVASLNEVLVGTEDGRVRKVALGADAGISVPAARRCLSGSRLAQARSTTRSARMARSRPGARSFARSGASRASEETFRRRWPWTARAMLRGPNWLRVPASSTWPRNDGVLSFITDSRGIDTSAPWPKYQHDPRNTGNSSTSLAEFNCP